MSEVAIEQGGRTGRCLLIDGREIAEMHDYPPDLYQIAVVIDALLDAREKVERKGR
jgi:hypothetical protein